MFRVLLLRIGICCIVVKVREAIELPFGVVSGFISGIGAFDGAPLPPRGRIGFGFFHPLVLMAFFSSFVTETYSTRIIS